MNRTLAVALVASWFAIGILVASSTAATFPDDFQVHFDEGFTIGYPLGYESGLVSGK